MAAMEQGASPPPADGPARDAGPRASQSMAGLPAGVWVLGGVSLCMDTSSELIHSLLPLFMVGSLGASVAAVGVVEGLAEATAAFTRIFSGWLSDRLGRRKLLAVAGYGLAALTKPLFPLAPSLAWVAAARFLDRVGKGIRGAPRDALVAELAPPERRGAAFGLRQSLDTAGAILGPLLAVALMAALAGDVRAVLWFAVLPALLSVLLLVLGVREPARPVAAAAPPLRLAAVRAFGERYWRAVALAALIALARFSEAFLLLRAAEHGLGMTLVPLLLAVMNLAYAVSAYPAGRLSDRLGRHGLLRLGLAALILADLLLAAPLGLAGTIAGTLLWGLHMGLSQGLLAALVGDTAPERHRGTAFGLLHLVTGVATLLASVIAGLAWQVWGAAATFLLGALLTGAALGSMRRLAR